MSLYDFTHKNHTAVFAQTSKGASPYNDARGQRYKKLLNPAVFRAGKMKNMLCILRIRNILLLLSSAGGLTTVRLCSGCGWCLIFIPNLICYFKKYS